MPERRPIGYLPHVEVEEDARLSSGRSLCEAHARLSREPYEEAGEDHAQKRDYGHDRGYAHEDRRDAEADYERVTDEDASHESYQGRGFAGFFPQAGNGSGAAPYAALHGSAAPWSRRGTRPIRGRQRMPSATPILASSSIHDLTLDTTTILVTRIRSDDELDNARTPELDLDNVLWRQGRAGRRISTACLIFVSGA